MPRPGEPNPIARFYARCTREQWLWILGSLLFVMTAIGAWDIWRDDLWPPEDADLAIEFTDVPREENALFLTRQLSSELRKELRPDPYYKVWHEENEPELQRKIYQLRQRIAPYWQRLDEILATATFSYDPDDADLTGNFFNIYDWDFLSDAIEWDAEVALEASQPDEAWTSLCRAFRLGRQIYAGQLTTLHSGAESRVQYGAFYILRDNPGAFAPDAETTRARTDELKSLRISKEPQVRSIQRHYRFARQHLDEMYQESHNSNNILPSAITFKRNRTLARSADLHRRAIAYLDLPLEQLLRTPEGWKDYDPESFHLINYYGQEALFLTEMLFRNLIRESQVDNDISRLALALAGYANEHDGNLPASLADLTPGYIDEIPLNPVTHGAWQYDPERRVISTGDGSFHLRVEIPE